MKRGMLIAIAVLLLGACTRTEESIATASISRQEICYKDECWEAIGNKHTPRGTFLVGSAKGGLEMGFKDDTMIVLPFLVLDPELVPKDNPLYDPSDRRTVSFAIHQNNLCPGVVAAGCLLVDRSIMPELAERLQGVQLEITE